jgi:hypothetical protein
MGELTGHGRSVTRPGPLTRYNICSKRQYRKQSSDQPFSIDHKGIAQLVDENSSFWLILSLYSWLNFYLP